MTEQGPKQLSGGLEAELGQLQATEASLPSLPSQAEAVTAAGLQAVCLGKWPRDRLWTLSANSNLH